MRKRGRTFWVFASIGITIGTIFASLIVLGLITEALESAVQDASGKGDSQKLRLLGSIGASMEETNLTYNLPPIVNASQFGKIDAVRFLLSKRVNVNKQDFLGRTALSAAAANGHLDIVQLLTENNADVNRVDKEGSSALMKSVSFAERPDITKFLLEHGADPRIHNNRRETAESIARRNKFNDIAAMLQQEVRP